MRLSDKDLDNVQHQIGSVNTPHQIKSQFSIFFEETTTDIAPGDRGLKVYKILSDKYSNHGLYSKPATSKAAPNK